jgi:hypothetical protein
MIKFIKDFFKKEEEKVDRFVEFAKSSSSERVKILRRSARKANDDQESLVQRYKSQFQN